MERKKYKLLMVDDSKTFNQKITDGLRDAGHEVVQSYTLTDSKKLIQEDEFDFILLDLILPDGEGDEVIDSLPDEKRAKVIVMSGDTDMQRRTHIFDSGILEYYSKSNPTNVILKDILLLLESLEHNSNINVLAVDDSSFMRRLIKGLLTPKRYNVLEAKDGEEALKILAENPVQLMLCDLEMPIMDGVKLVEKIKSQPKYLELPIIMISSKDDKSLIARVLKHGARDFIKKPFSTEEFLLKCDLHIKDHLNVEFIKQKELQLQEALNTVRKNEDQKLLFLANMSHEIRTPLNGIIGFTDILKEEIGDEHTLNLLNNIHQSGEHLLNIINDILDFSKIESNKLDILLENFSLEELVNSLISLNSLNAKNKHIDFTINVSKDIPKVIKSDYLRLKQILVNLTNNAIKFTPEHGRVKVDIEHDEKNHRIYFHVVDNGIGIDPKHHDKVFDLFSQAEEDTTKKFGGTGLGLNISAKLIELLGGKISLESELNKGATFSFFIPILELNETVLKEKSRVLENLTFNNHILLVEDNKMNQQLMIIMLKKLGLSFDIANDGIEGVEMYKQNSYDLVLMDENMPNMNGTLAIQLIREYENESSKKYTPVIALTANAVKGDREKFLEAGMDEYLTKPLKKDVLVEMLDKFLVREDYKKPNFGSLYTLNDALEAIKINDIEKAQKILEQLKGSNDGEKI